MQLSIPKAFLDKMKLLLGNDFQAFYESYQRKRTFGLRINTLKVSISKFLEVSPFNLEPIPWINEGFYYKENERPGRHPYHAAGLYYIQEPSAMAAVGMLNPQPGERVLDLAAAPGGKATQIAAAMNNQGLLIANEPYPARAKILAENIERLGVRNTVVTNETPERLKKKFSGFFDRILLDAPCSGEGMFRKDPESCKEWQETLPVFCAKRQWEIFIEAEKMLKPGGYLLYSTCTFSPEENEQFTERVLETYHNMELVTLPCSNGFKRAENAWIQNGKYSVSGAIRIWPNFVQGEGHYMALFYKKDGVIPKDIKTKARKLSDNKIKELEDFSREFLRDIGFTDYRLFGRQIYSLPIENIDIDGLKVIRPGLHIGTLQKNRFEPSHALALILKPENAAITADYTADSLEIQKYLQGGTLNQIGNNKGWTLVSVDGFSIGWGKQSDGLLKNHYPKGLRMYFN